MKNLQKGFTLIELLVVIAIIGILSSIVLASLSSARTKGEDAAIQSSLTNMRAQAELYYSTNSNYGTATIDTSDTACDTQIFNSATTGGLKALVDSVQTRTTVTCGSSATAWAVSAVLKASSTQHFCVDSTGKAAVQSAALTGLACS